ncbi:MAG: cytochrome P450 [Solirubrobacteraceae bacterium]
MTVIQDAGHTSSIAHVELYDPLYHSPQPDLYEIYRRMRDEHPVYHNADRDVWCLSRFADVQAAARDWQTFSNADGVVLDAPAQFFGPGDFLESDPPRHDVLRKVARPFFLPKEIARLEQQVDARVAELIERLVDQQRIDIARDFAWPLPIWIICRLLGVPPEDDALVHRLVTDLETRYPGDTAPRKEARSALRELISYAEDLARHKRRAPRDDLVSRLIAGEAEDEPRRDEIPGIVVLLLTAGSVTTASLIGNTLFLLAEHPDVQDMLRGGLTDIQAVIEESLRIESPVQYLARLTTKPASVHGIEIPEGADVILIWGSANRDERHFERPDVFDVQRRKQRNLTFGEGIHFCLGAPLARLEARIAVPAFLNAFTSYEIGGSIERFFNHTVRGFAQLPATVR